VCHSFFMLLCCYFMRSSRVSLSCYVVISWVVVMCHRVVMLSCCYFVGGSHVSFIFYVMLLFHG